jgi:hypothetical protein
VVRRWKLWRWWHRVAAAEDLEGGGGGDEGRGIKGDSRQRLRESSTWDGAKWTARDAAPGRSRFSVRHGPAHRQRIPLIEKK